MSWMTLRSLRIRAKIRFMSFLVSENTSKSLSTLLQRMKCLLLTGQWSLTILTGSTKLLTRIKITPRRFNRSVNRLISKSWIQKINSFLSTISNKWSKKLKRFWKLTSLKHNKRFQLWENKRKLIVKLWRSLRKSRQMIEGWNRGKRIRQRKKRKTGIRKRRRKPEDQVNQHEITLIFSKINS